MHIASESSLKKLVSEDADKIVDEPERLLKGEEENPRLQSKDQEEADYDNERMMSNENERMLGGKIKVTAPTSTHYTPHPGKGTKIVPNAPTPNPKNIKPTPQVCKAPSWKKWGWYDEKYLGLDGLQSFPARCHTHTIIFLHGFTADGRQIRWAPNHILSKHARVVAPSAPLYHYGELKGYIKWYHKNEKYTRHYHSWSKPRDYHNSIKSQIRRVWELIEREAKALGGDYKRIFLVGHSQGADLALQAGVSFHKRLGGIVPLQNWAWGPAWLGKHHANIHTPILTILGRQDPIVKLNDAKSRMNDPFWQSNRKNNVRLEVWHHLRHAINHHVLRRVNHWINHRVHSKWKN